MLLCHADITYVSFCINLFFLIVVYQYAAVCTKLDSRCILLNLIFNHQRHVCLHIPGIRLTYYRQHHVFDKEITLVMVCFLDNKIHNHDNSVH